MPLPTPRTGEKRTDFISRCMGSSSDEFPDSSQRLAVCHTRWQGRKRESVADKIDSILEVMFTTRKTRLLAKGERKLEAALGRAFRRQGILFLRLTNTARLRESTVLLQEEFPPGWETMYAQAALETFDVFEGPLEEALEGAILAGGEQATADLSLSINVFDLDNPRAVTYLERNAAKKVTNINTFTRGEMRRIIVKGVQEGDTYTKIANTIRDKFTSYATVGEPRHKKFTAPSPLKHIRNRAELIAVTEMADAYEQGNKIVAEDLRSDGVPIEKSWLTVGDRRVDPDCVSNEAEGWIELGDSFPAGRSEPPQHPGCRCTALQRRITDARRRAPPATELGALKKRHKEARRFRNSKDADAFLRGQGQDVTKLTPNEQAVARGYKGEIGEPGYDAGMNSWLRTGEASRYDWDEFGDRILADAGPGGYYTTADRVVVEETWANLAGVLDSAISKTGGALERDTILYRGVASVEEVFGSDFLSALGRDPESVVGTALTDDGFASTSLLQWVGDGFTLDEEMNWVKTDSARINILALKGSRGFSHFTEASEEIDIFPGIGGEAEWLLPRGSTFRVIEVKKDPEEEGRWLIDVILQ